MKTNNAISTIPMVNILHSVVQNVESLIVREFEYIRDLHWSFDFRIKSILVFNRLEARIKQKLNDNLLYKCPDIDIIFDQKDLSASSIKEGLIINCINGKNNFLNGNNNFLISIVYVLDNVINAVFLNAPIRRETAWYYKDYGVFFNDDTGKTRQCRCSGDLSNKNPNTYKDIIMIGDLSINNVDLLCNKIEQNSNFSFKLSDSCMYQALSILNNEVKGIIYGNTKSIYNVGIESLLMALGMNCKVIDLKGVGKVNCILPGYICVSQ